MIGAVPEVLRLAPGRVAAAADVAAVLPVPEAQVVPQSGHRRVGQPQSARSSTPA